MTTYYFPGRPHKCATCPATIKARTAIWCDVCRVTEYPKSQKLGEKRARRAKQVDRTIAEIMARRIA